MPTPDKRFVVEVFEATADQYPDNIAIEHDGNSVTYAELKDRVATIAAHLREAGVGPDVIVATCLEPGADYLATLLGVMKVGAIVLPMDLDFPATRLNAILRRTTPGIVIGDAGSLRRLAERISDLEARGIQTACMETSGALDLPPLARGTSVAQFSPDDGCYLMYTSGSTGEPKAILGCHKSLSHFMHWEAREFELDQSLRVSQFAPLTFDASLRDFLLPLIIGGRVCVPSREDRMNPRRLVEWIEESGVTLVHCVPSFFRVLTAEIERREEAAPLPRLQRILMAGEALHGKDVLRWMDRAGDRVELVNLYGCSETTLIKTFHRISGRPSSPASIIPVGQPISNTAVLIVKGGRLCGIGEIGDIYIHTPFATKGYYQDPEATAASFVPHPLEPENGQRVYRTGDMGRYLPDRSVEFIGRLDSQVKVNGIRVELGEVERAINGHPDVEQGVILAITSPHNEKTLACYYTEAKPVTSESLREHLSTILPDYMVPTFFVRMDEFPLNINGKVDRKALPKPEEVLYQQVSYEAPASPEEEKIAGIWADVLGLEKVGVNNVFAELGGHSLQAIRIISRIFRAFDVEMSILAFFNHPTVRQQATLLAEQSQSAYREIPSLPDRPAYPLSAAQRRLWVVAQIDGGLDAYTNTHAAILEGPLDVAALRSAMEVVYQRHESLRTVFVVESGQPVQKVLTGVTVPLEVGVVASGSTVAELVDEEGRKPMDLERGPLFRARLVQLERPDRHLLIVTMHHIISDGWSMGVFESDFFACYESIVSGADQPMPKLRIQYRDFAAWQNERLSSDVIGEHRDYWLKKLGGELQALDRLADHPRPAVFTYRGRTCRYSLDSELGTALKAMASREEATFFMALVAMVKVLLYRYTGVRDLVVGSPEVGRDHADLEGQIGFFAQTLVLRDTLCERNGFRDALRKVRDTWLEAYDHRDYPFDDLVDALGVRRDPSRNPLFDVMVVLQEETAESRAVGPLTVADVEVKDTTSRFDLTFNFMPTATGITLDINFCTDLFENASINRLAAHLDTLIRSAVTEPKEAIADLEILDSHERSRILTHSLGPVRESSGHTSIAAAFEAQVNRTPNRPALIGEDGEMTYAALNDQANRLAGFLREQCGLKPGECVAAMLPRGSWNVVALLGILKAGGTYLPMDPEHPAERLRYMLSDSAAKIALSDETVDLSVFGGDDAVGWVNVREACNNGRPLESSDFSPPATAYVIYTSGSTGRPKGVAVGHEGFINMAMAQIEGFGVQPEDRVLQFFSPAFDGSLSEIFMALFAGAVLVPVTTDDILDRDRFEAFLRNHCVTVASLTPSFLTRLRRRGLESLRVLITAGESAIPEDVRWYSKRLRYFNAYGPTETSVCAAFHEVSPSLAGDKRSAIPVGKPIANMAIYVLDEALQLVPEGVPGEICIAGSGVALGYLNNPGLTAQRFVANPFGKGRMYRTGDLGRWLEDGELEFLGRMDAQVKVRGHRIECGEVEYWLTQCPGVEHAAVIVRGESRGDHQLVAYVVTDAPMDPSVLRERLGQQLPDFMIPDLFVELDEFPLSPTGKLDSSRLPMPGTSSLQTSKPETEIEGQLAEIWAQVLGRPVGIDENFFEAGGHSLRAMETASAIRSRFSVDIRIVDFYQAPTIHGMARLLDQRTGQSETSQPYLRFNEGGSTTVFAFPAVADADSLVYERVASRLAEAQIYAFRFVQQSDLVGYYADLISEIQKSGPIVLLGYSAGGNLAFRVATELESRGRRIADLVLLDSFWRGQADSPTQQDLAAQADMHLEYHPAAREENGDFERDSARRSIKRYLSWLYEKADSGMIDSDIHLIQAGDNACEDSAGLWRTATKGDLHVYQGAGTHYEMLFDDNADANVRRIRTILQSASVSA